MASYLKDNAEQRQSPDPNDTWGHGFAKLPPPDGAPPTVPAPSNAFTRNPAEDFDTLEAAGNTGPQGIWSDGTTMWVADWLEEKIYAYDTATRARVPGKDFNTLKAAGNTGPQGIWSDGTTMWVADSLIDRIYAYDTVTRARVAEKDFNTLKAARNVWPRGIWSDGTTMWVADSLNDKIYAYDMATRARVPEKDFNTLKAARNVWPRGIWSDGTTMWVADSLNDKIYAYDMATRARVPGREFNTLESAGNWIARGIWSDRTTMWVADYWDQKIYAYHMMQAESASDREALIALYNATGGPNWTNNVNWVTPEPIGQWYGVATDFNGRVINLLLHNNQLNGTIPAELGNLTNLASLRLDGNRLTGEIPAELGRLANLTLLYLSGNQLTGCVPESLRDVADNDFVQLRLAFCIPEGSPGVTVSHAGMDPTPPVRIGTAIPVAVAFTETVTGFTAGDVAVGNGTVSNFLGSAAAYTFDVTPNAIGQVTVDIGADVAEDADGNRNTAAVQLQLGIPYDDNRNGLIERDEVIKAINDYLGDGTLERSHVIALINLYLSPAISNLP